VELTGATGASRLLGVLSAAGPSPAGSSGRPLQAALESFSLAGAASGGAEDLHKAGLDESLALTIALGLPTPPAAVAAGGGQEAGSALPSALGGGGAAAPGRGGSRLSGMLLPAAELPLAPLASSDQDTADLLASIAQVAFDAAGAE